MSNQPIGGVAVTGSQLANSRYGDSAQAATDMFNTKKKSVSPFAAKLLAEITKTHPLVSPGVATGLALSGVPANSDLAWSVVNEDVNSQVSEAKKAAAKILEATKEKGQGGSKVDILAPVTRGLFTGLSFPFEFLEALARNAFNKGPDVNPVMQTSLGQVGKELINERGQFWKVSTGSGFVGIDPTTEVGKALKAAQIKASGPSAQRAWTYGNAASRTIINSGVFGEVEDKTARTIEGIVSFATNILLDPISYVPGIGFTKINQAKKLGKLTETTGKNLTGLDETVKSVAADAARRSAQIGELESKVVTAQGTIKDLIRQGIDDSDAVFRLENEASRLNGLYGPEYINYQTKLREYVELRKAGQPADIDAVARANALVPQADQAALADKLQEVEVARQTLLRSRAEREQLIKARVRDVEKIDKIKGKDARGLQFVAGLLERDGRFAVDFDKVQDAILGGRLGEDLSKVIVDMKDPATIWQAFGGNISRATARELADANSTGEVLTVIGKNIGVEFDGKIGMATKARLSKASRAMQFEASNALDPGSQLRFGRTLSLLATLDSKLPLTKASTLIDNPLTRYMPRGVLLSLNDGDGILKEFDRTMSALKVNPQLRTDLTRNLINADNPAATFEAVIDGIKTVTDDLIERAGTSLTTEQKKALQQASMIFKRNGKTDFTAIAGRSEDVGTDLMLKGEVNSLDPILDSQMTYAIRMPEVQDMRRYVTSIGKLLSKNPSLDDLSASATTLFDQTFKQAVLVGRVSYVARNLIDTQVRQYLTGGVTLFNHPLSYIGMVIGNPEGNALARTFAKFSRYDQDILGNRFDLIAQSAPLLDREAMVNAHKLAVIMGRTQATALSDISMRKLPTGVQFIRSNNPKFNEAWAGQLNVLRDSELVQFAATAHLVAVGGKIAKQNQDVAKFIDDALKTGKNEKEAFIDYLYTTEKGNETRKIIASANKDFASFADDTPEARRIMGDYYENYIAKPIEVNTGNNRALIEYLAGNPLTIPAGAEVILKSYDAKDVARVLAEYRKDIDVENVIGMIKAPIDNPDKVVRRGWDKTVKSFFGLAARFEARTAFGPEFRHQYWMEASKRFGLLSKSEAEKVLAIAERELQGLRLGGKVTPVHPAIRNMRSQLNRLDERGLDRRNFDDLILTKAADNISNLFYDAVNKKEWAAATRVMLPFAQAWSNTLATWGKMIATNPIADYKALNLYDWFNKPESSFVYDWVNDNWYDPSQGFIFTDPQRGEKRFIMPFAGDFLGGVLSVAFGETVPSMPGFASVSSLNVAFQTELLPGVGPALSMSLGPIIKEQEGWWADTLREIIYPFGAPEGDIESTVGQFVPAWVQRLSYGFGLDYFEGKNLSTLKPLMAYLATTGKYGEFPIDQENQNKLMEDAARLNRYLALWRGITQNVSPANIQPQILSKDKDGTYHVQSMMYNEFARFRMADPDNYGLATAKFADAFGEGALFALVANTSGAPAEPTTDAWKFYSSNRDVAAKYPEAFAMFFPGGDFSYEFAQWQQRRGQAERLTPQEQVRLATARIYSARKSRLEEKQKALLQQGYDPKDANAWYSTAKEELDAEFGGAPELRSTGLPREQLINQAVGALNESQFAETDAGKGLSKFLEYREKAFAAAEARGYKSLNGKNVRDIANWLKEWGYYLIQEHNDFSVMYFRLFESETDER